MRITRDAYARAGHFAADHPYMGVLEDVEHRAAHAEVWVAESAGKVVAAVTLTFAGQPYIGAISITSATFMERAHALYGSLGFRRAPERDWHVPGEDVLLWVFTLELGG
ncbi:MULTISPECIES: hypothetical protein [unclassified Arthrobacter]|uniref:hypothetical protein n=1 Tax=Arthrobacter sp. StoSoilB19 TaxID=2830994 RepID=UPI0009D98E02|nr:MULTISPECIES: hypothetical protein [unclassified Arthrobacter]